MLPYEHNDGGTRVPKALPHPYQRVQELIERIGPIWQEAMCLSHYEIKNVFLDTFHPEDEGDDLKTTAETQARWQYLMAKVNWHMPSAARSSDEELERVLVHEYVHIQLAAEQGLVAVQKDMEKVELATEMVTRAYMKLGGSKL